MDAILEVGMIEAIEVSSRHKTVEDRQLPSPEPADALQSLLDGIKGEPVGSFDGGRVVRLRPQTAT